MTDLLVLPAVELEARGLARELELERAPRFSFPVFERSGRVRLRVAPTGLRARLLPDRWPALVADLATPLVISAGTCGALVSELEVGDLVLPESVLGLSGERLNVTPGAHAAALRCAGRARRGLLLTASDVVASPAAKAERGGTTGAVAVDMESAAILAWASRHGAPALVVRAVSDTVNQPVPPELLGLVSAEGRLRADRVLTLALTHPAVIPRALVLRRGTRKALRSVARLLAALAAR